MRRYLPLCLLGVLLAHSSGCGESPNRPSVVAETPIPQPKTSARFIQVPWDISLFFNIPGGAVVADATTAATSGNGAPGDNLTGTYSNTNGFGGTISGVLTGTLDSGTFDGTLTTVTPAGCVAERRYSGPLTSTALNWSPGSHVNDCGGTSPLTTGIQAAAAPPTTQPPCSYSASVTATSFPAAGGTGTVNVTAGSGCTWFANTTASFVTVSAGQGSGNGSVQFTVAANTSTASRTATLVVAGQSFTITQAGAPAPVCTYALNDGERLFGPDGALGGVDMRAPAGCAWTAQSDAPWLTITGGASGSGNGTISFALSANPSLSERIGTITASGQTFRVRQSPITCNYTVTGISATAFPYQGGTATASLTTQAICGWGSTSSVPWITTSGGGTGPGTLTITIAANPDPVARSGILNIAGRAFTITQAAAPCVFTLTASATTFPAGGGSGAVTVTTHAACSWQAQTNVTWITFSGPISGSGPATVAFVVAAHTGTERIGEIGIGGPAVRITQQAYPFVPLLTGRVTNTLNGGPVAGATVRFAHPALTTSVVTDASGNFVMRDLPAGTATLTTSAPGFTPVTETRTFPGGQAASYSVALAPIAPTVTMTFAPNPVFPNPADLHCGQPETQWCWTYGSTIREASGSTLTVTAWEINLYDVTGALYQHNVYTQADFARFYNGATTVPGGSAAIGGAVIWFNSPSGGSVDIVVSGTDAVGRTHRFVSSPRLSVQPEPIGTRTVPPGTAVPPSSPPPRPRGGR